ncbi:uncharacterized protein LOC112525788 isoform X2 [Cynara cardunculus var. scolymus]|uniref:uncharacterized protein LOC112525788 isoform X2 n=1 Tax=Cynara cardunculus var. scolymus TaxID=59895 RepID=UPI000D63105B|nr:uncharacterized protein LOC112525788 isoform X2 [Cynara cardunculus var. scolymus]
MIPLQQRHANMSSLHSPSLSKLRCTSATEFTFCDISDINYNKTPMEHEDSFVFSPSFTPNPVYSGYNCSSPTNERRNKIMEMMNNLSESCQELSLKDIVVDDLERVQPVVKQTSFKGKKTIRKKSIISRSVSLDTGVFMLKMFIPVSLGTKKSRSSSMMSADKNSFSTRSSNKSNDKYMPMDTKSRSEESAPGCWFINQPSKPKPTSRRGCIF